VLVAMLTLVGEDVPLPAAERCHLCLLTCLCPPTSASGMFRRLLGGGGDKHANYGHVCCSGLLFREVSSNGDIGLGEKGGGWDTRCSQILDRYDTFYNVVQLDGSMCSKPTLDACSLDGITAPATCIRQDPQILWVS